MENGLNLVRASDAERVSAEIAYRRYTVEKERKEKELEAAKKEKQHIVVDFINNEIAPLVVELMNDGERCIEKYHMPEYMSNDKDLLLIFYDLLTERGYSLTGDSNVLNIIWR